MLFETGSEREIISYGEYPYLVYGRVSSDKDEQISSLENQVDICRHWIENNGFEWNENAIVIDDGITGTVLLDRKAMQLILYKARRKEIKMVIFKSIHRLARDTKDSLEIREILIAHGVRLVTLEEDYDSLYEGKNDMKFEMYSLFASQYPKSLSVSISGALAAKVRRGEHLGQIPYGYKTENKKLIIDEEIAPTIRKMFSWYNNDGLGYKSIVHKLNDELAKGNVVPPKRTNKWQLTTVQTILKNSAYCGTFIHNKYTKVKLDGRKKQIVNPREKWKIYEDYHPGIVTKEEWQKANSKKHPNYRKKITPWNEFRKILVCSECGSNIIINQSYKKKKNGERNEWHYLKCSAYRRAGENGCVNHTPILYKDFRTLILKELENESKNISINFENTLYKQKEKEIVSLNVKKEKLLQKNKDLLDTYLEKIISKEEFITQRKEYESEIEIIKDKIFMLSQEENRQIEINNIKEAFEQLHDHDRDLFHVFTTLLNKITLYPDGKIDIDYKFKKHL